MTDIVNALIELEVADWVLKGENTTPTNEAEFNACFKKITGVDASGTAIESSDPIDFGITWAEVSAKKAELEAAEPMRLLREKRTLLLAETDWWGLSDHTMTDEQTAYRQALRDITTHTNWPDLADSDWPTRPS